MATALNHQCSTDYNVPWYSPETGIYTSKHPPRHLPTDPFLDVVSFIFSHPHNGTSALIDFSSGYSISYSQLFQLIKSVGYGLLQMGISSGDCILILLPNSIYFPIVLLGALYVGVIVTPMNPLSTYSEIKKQTSGRHISLAFTCTENVRKVQGLGVKIIQVPENGDFDDQTAKYSEFQELIFCCKSIIPRPRIRQDDTAAILYSSGTTGASKGVVVTHRNFIAMVELFARFEASQYKEKSWENVYLDVLPMFHIYGLALFGMGLLSLGLSVVVMSRFDVNVVVKAIDKYKVTHFPVVPLILSALMSKAKGITGVRLRSLKQVSSGAATLSRNLIEEFLSAFPHVDLIQGYGMTESTAVGTRGFNKGKFQKHNSVGLLAPNMQAKIVNWNIGSCMPPGNAGELWLRGPAIVRGYLDGRGRTMSAIENDGWLRTGDVGYFDTDGFLFFLDRLKEIIKYKGFQIAPADLEAILLSHPDIIDAAVIAAADEEAGEIPVAFVVKKPSSLLSHDEVFKYVAKQVAPYKKVRQVVFVASIPKSAAGKVLRRKLKSLLTSKI